MKVNIAVWHSIVPQRTCTIFDLMTTNANLVREKRKHYNIRYGRIKMYNMPHVMSNNESISVCYISENISEIIINYL